MWRGHDSEVQAELLKGVYEDNLRIAGKSSRRRERPRLPRAAPLHRAAPRPWRRGVALMAVAGLVLAGGVAYHDSTATAPGVSDGVVESAATGVPGPAPSARAGTPSAGPAAREVTESFDAPAVGYSGLLDEPATNVADLFGLDVKTIVIDPGHGGRDPGAVGPTGLQEKEVTLDIARRLQSRLSQRPGYEVLLTRDEDAGLALRDRVEFANRHQADLFLSVHINYQPSERVNLVETYYFGAHTDDAARRLAAWENSSSGYSVADFKEIVSRLGKTLKRQESRRLARSVQGSVYTHMRRYNASVMDVGIKTAPFVVLLGVDSPAVLAELTCISNRQEEKRLATETYRRQLTYFLEEGIVRYLREKGNQKKLVVGGQDDGTKGAETRWERSARRDRSGHLAVSHSGQQRAPEMGR